MSLEEIKSTLISANHILHYNKVLDAYGHVSVRHPERPDVYIMSASVAPALVSSPADLIEYHVSDSSPVDTNSKRGYQERFIHSEIYKKYPDVNSVIHSHSEAVVPYTMNGVPMRPAFHIGGFLGYDAVKIWHIAPLYQPGDQQDMLVNCERFGSALASSFSHTGSSQRDQNVVLMANHGFTTVGISIQQAVYRAVYTHINAGVQSNAIIMRNAYFNSMPKSQIDVPEPTYLSGDQIAGCMNMNDDSQSRPWALWVREVEACPLYVHNMSG